MRYRITKAQGSWRFGFDNSATPPARNLFVRGSVPTELSRTCYSVAPRPSPAKLSRVMWYPQAASMSHRQQTQKGGALKCSSSFMRPLGLTRIKKVRLSNPSVALQGQGRFQGQLNNFLQLISAELTTQPAASHVGLSPFFSTSLRDVIIDRLGWSRMKGGHGGRLEPAHRHVCMGGLSFAPKRV